MSLLQILPDPRKMNQSGRLYRHFELKIEEIIDVRWFNRLTRRNIVSNISRTFILELRASLKNNN